MEISCDIKKKYFTCYDEAKGVANNRKYILKHRKTNRLSYLQKVLFTFIGFSILDLLFVAFCWYCYCNFYLCIASGILFMITILYLILNLLFLLPNYFYRKKKNFKSSIKVTEKGIVDKSFYGIEMTFYWEKVKAIVIKKNSITILTDTPVYFYFEKSKEKELVNTITSYKKDIMIIK